MVVTLVPMTSEEYETFLQMSRDDQVNDLVAGGMSYEEAVRATDDELKDLLPEGQDTENNFLMMIRTEEDLKAVGYIWTLHELTGDMKQSFLCDLLIYEDSRRRGYAREALCLMEQSAYLAGCEESILYVSKDNKTAASVYDRCGYSAFREEGDGMYMRKRLTGEA